MESQDLLTELRQVPELKNVPEEQLRWLLARTTLQELPANVCAYRHGDLPEHMNVILEGRCRLYRGPVAAGIELLDFVAPCITSLLPFSRMSGVPGDLRTVVPTRWLQLHRDHFRDLVRDCFELTDVVVHIMVERARNFTQFDQQTEKMAALGLLSAGLAHELNNPAAAVARTAATQGEYLRAAPRLLQRLLAHGVTEAQLAVVNERLGSCRYNRPAALTMLERARREDALTDWLDEHALENPHDLVEPLVEAGFGPADLDAIAARLEPAALGAVLDWLANTLVCEKLTGDIGEAAQRIATLVGSMKVYTHMDRGEGQEPVHLGEGLTSTLTMLDHKLRQKKATFQLTVPPDLPPVPGWTGQLNQVWTNLLDNAIDALPPTGGRLEIQTEATADFVLTRIIDNGAGIPANLLGRIFEPFFTTKPIGQGTGLGLDIVRRIVEKRHNGSIKVDSVPGRTEFRICLPLEAK